MLVSSDEMKRRPGFVGVAVSPDRVEGVDLAAGQGDEGLVVPFVFGLLAPSQSRELTGRTQEGRAA